MTPRSIALLSLLPLCLATLACHSTRSGDCCGTCQEAGPQVSAPIDLSGTAYDLAMSVELPEVAPQESPGLHNLYHLSESIISGSEPHGQEALEALAQMGVKTIVSVDGKEPEVEAAAALGMRYVHVPIQYSEISPEEMLKLSKSFRELDGPFYVHCFHGRHRGPAAAEVGRLVLDGIPRQEAVAEMRQYCGTSKKYEGLYRIIAAGHVPSARESAGYSYDFPARELPEGVVGSMVVLSRAHDNTEFMQQSGWKPDPTHPDLDPINEATQLVQGFAAGQDLHEVRTAASDFRGWWEDGLRESRGLVQAIKEVQAGTEGAGVLADQHFAAVRQSCKQCHTKYRNH